MNAGLFAVEISHKTARLAIRETLAARCQDIGALLLRARDLATETVVLSTCGRFELYFQAVREVAEDWPARIAELTGVSAGLLAPGLRTYAEDETARHLLRVAAGLESPIMGEAHVLGQVREAYLRAMAVRTTGPVLSALFRAAIHTGKRVRTETPLGQAARTYADLALAQVRAGVSAGSRVVVIGSGTLGWEVAEALAAQGTHALIIVSRHAGRAAALAAQVGAAVADYGQLRDEIQLADAVVACTSGASPVVEAEMLEGRLRPLTVIDLGMPRNVEPAAVEVPHIRLKCLADLLGEHALPPALTQAVEAIIAEEEARFGRWLEARRGRGTPRARVARGAGRRGVAA
jgi:glutamyl-tRNA reductase